jgi:hypothetical protein
LRDLALFLKDPHLAAEQAQLLQLGAGEPVVTAALVQVGLLDPDPQALLGHA